MTQKTQKKRGSSQWILALMGLVLLAGSACNSRSSTTKTGDEEPAGAATAQKTANPNMILTVSRTAFRILQRHFTIPTNGTGTDS
jgi:hypothetical protein